MHDRVLVRYGADLLDFDLPHCRHDAPPPRRPPVKLAHGRAARTTRRKGTV